MRHAEQSALSPPVRYRFGLFEADPGSGTLTRSGVRVRIQEQPFRALVALFARPREIVTREELRLWPEGTFVDFDGSFKVIVGKLRAAIGDDPNNPRFVETIAGKGCCSSSLSDSIIICRTGRARRADGHLSTKADIV